MTDPNDFDSILSKFTEGGKVESSELDKLMALEKLRIDARERADAVAREEARRDREESRRGEFMKMLLGLGTTLLPALMNRGTDPAILALLSNRSGSDEMSKMMEMQRQQNMAAMESLKTALFGVMNVKDELHKQTVTELIDKIESAREDSGGSEGGFAGTLREVRLSLGALASTGMLGAPPAAPPTAIAAPPASSPTAANPGAHPKPAGQPAPPARRPVEVVLQQLMALQQGKVAKPQLVKAAMCTVALQDEELTKLLLSDSDDAMARILDYCQPFVVADQTLMAWIMQPGVGEWVQDYVMNKLVPLIDEAMAEDDEPADDEAEAAGEAPGEPEVLGPASVAPVVNAPLPATGKV